MAANLVSLIRTLLAFYTISLLFTETAWSYGWAFFLTALVIAMDALDGYVARKLNQASKLGAVVDILGDRIVEQLYWITFLALGWIPLWMVLSVVTRGIVVDGLRAIALEQGYTAFGNQTLQQSAWAKALVAGNMSRTAYAVFKALAFTLLILGHLPGLDADLAGLALNFGNGCAWIAVFFCLARGLPVLIEGRRFFGKVT
ncbi:MAG: CDP-alcohol phosphatidyltransferase family protein [Cyanobacteria bacterium P01_H01_bin.74]